MKQHHLWLTEIRSVIAGTRRCRWAAVADTHALGRHLNRTQGDGEIIRGWRGDALDEEVEALLKEAARRAEANDRQTVMAQDL